MRLRRFAALSMVAACGLSLTTATASVGAAETRPDAPASIDVVSSIVVAPDAPSVAASGADDAAVVDVTVAPPGNIANDPGAASSLEAAVAQAPRSAGSLDFGDAPSGVVPILFNDHHIYAKPDELRRGRLLAALVKNDAIMVPMRSLFEALGATVSYDPTTRAIALHRRGVDVSLTVGKPSIVIDGETRPLDVPPEIANGIVLVPVRVCSEVFGAYVQYIPQLHVVAIRYLANTAPPPAPLAPVPLTAQSAPPTPGPRRVVPPGAPIPKLPPGLETIIVVDTMISPQVSNEFADRVSGPTGQNYQLRGATEFDFLGGGFELDASFREERYDHPLNFVNAIGGGSTLVPAFTASENQLDLHAGVRLSPEKFYLVFGYATQTTHYGYPRVSGLGIGLTKLPALDRRISIEGSIVYYPNLYGQCDNVITCRSEPETLAYSAYRYYGGLTLVLLPHLFLEGGYIGDSRKAKAGFPAGGTYGAPFAGLGARF